jgi:anti-sigma regulatory factor (Ser/Thr protein kinase)
MGGLEGDPSPSASVRLLVQPEPNLLATVRLVVATVGRRAGLDDELVEDLKVAVSEICSAAIREADEAAEAPIEVDLFDEGDRFGVEIRDRCPPDDGVARDPFGAADDRDFGLALVGSLVDELDTADRPGGGFVTRFWLAPHERTGGSGPSE